MPGGPWDREKPLNAGTVARLNAIYGLNKPIWEQYISWFGGMLQLDFGPSYQYRDRGVNQILATGWPITVQLGLMEEQKRERRGTPEAALQFAHKSTAELLGEIPEGDIDQALIPSIEEVPSAGAGAGDEDNGSKPN